MIGLIATWFVFCVALYRTMRLMTEMFEDNRNTAMLISENVNVGKVIHPSFTTFRLGITSFAWACFGLLLMA